MKARKILSALTALTMLPTVGMVLPNTALAEDTAKPTVVQLNPAEASPFNNGKFEGWGTSLCWWANRLGYSEKLTETAAKAFFSDEGLGLDIARYNLGGGDDPTHNHVTRSDSKVPGVWKSFTVSEDGKDVDITEYDITKDQNQLNIAKAALEQNPNLYFEGFSNSAPYFMTNSGCSSGAASAGDDNLNPDMYDDFGEFIAEATQLLKDNGIEFKSYSPMNEPDTTYWGANSPKQEGCHFDPGESQSKAIVETRKALDAAGLTDVIVAGMDETSIDKSLTNVDKLTDEALADLGRLDTHTYSGSKRTQLKAKAIEKNKKLWMSEVDAGGDGAKLASMIITDMNGMQPAAWVMWDIVDLHKDSNFTAPDGTKPEANNSLAYTGSVWGVGMADHDNETLFLSNKYYAYGQFTRYINPGDTIIASSGSTLAAYNAESGDIKIVANNTSASDLDYEFDLSGFVNVGNTVTEIRTDMAGNEKWAEIENEATLSGKTLDTKLKANTVTTYVISGNTPIENYAVITGSASIQRNATATMKLSTNLSGDVEWSTSDSSIATVDANGVVTGVNPGTVTVNAKIGDYTASKTIEIDVYASIKNAPSSLKPGKSASLSCETNADGTPVWSVDNSDIAEISQDGALTAKATGTVTVKVEVGGAVATKAIKISLYSLSGTASWSNADSTDYTMAADGDFNTAFDGLKNGYIQYDYGEPYKITAVKLAARSGYTARTVGGTIQGSNDGISWTDLYKLTSEIPSGKYTEVKTSELANNYAYRYFRYTNTENEANIAEFIIEAESAAAQQGEPTVKDITELTDDFENSVNIFNASAGDLSADGNQVYASGLARFGNVFVPVKSTATAETDIVLTDKDKFRLTYNMFAGWENNGKDNSMSIKNADGNEIFGYTITGGGYNLTELRIGGTDVLADVSTKPVSQCKTTSKGANGWNASSQSYVNNVGLNKTVEIIISGNGEVTASFNGGAADLSYSGTISAPISIKALELTGSYNAARGRVVSYDNFDADVISYTESVPVNTPDPTEKPTEAPQIPANGELINMNFDNKDLTSSSSYGKASGTPKFAEVDGKTCIQFDGSSATVVTLTDANGNSLLSGQDEFTISFKVKPTTNSTSWWFFASPDAGTQTYQKEKYLGVLTNAGTLTAERYNNNGSRPASASGTYNTNEWNDVTIAVEKDKTTVYVNGTETEQTSDIDVKALLGSSSVAYIGRANWGTGEYATGYLDDFVIRQGISLAPAVTMPDLTDVKGDIALPAKADDGSAIVWTSSNTAVIANDGKVTRPKGSSENVMLTGTITTASGDEFTVKYTATVVGLSAALDTFTAYAEDGAIKFSSDYNAEDTPYTMYTALYNSDGIVESVKLNTASGSFEVNDNDVYTVKCFMWDDMAAYHEVVSKTIKVKDELDTDAYLFVHFVGTEADANQEQIYFSVSEDGKTWKTINNNSPILTSDVGEKGVRDPYILRGEDGKFFIIATYITGEAIQIVGAPAKEAAQRASLYGKARIL